jgi:hypothetical protein
MNYKSPSGWSSIVFSLSIFASILFSILWLREREHKPKEIIKEIEKPVEVIKEVEKPIEIVKEVEVPAKLTESQEIAIEIGNAFINAQTKSRDEALKDIKAVSLNVNIHEEITDDFSKDKIQNKLELNLRQLGLEVITNSTPILMVSINGFWDKEKITCTYTVNVELYESVFVVREKQIFQQMACVWSDFSFGRAGNLKIKTAVLESIQTKYESFANLYMKYNYKKQR